MITKRIKTHEELDVYQMAFKIAMNIYSKSKTFPKEERYSLTDQIRRSSRSVCANIAEAFRRRKYGKYFVARLNDSEAEAAESQVWLDFAFDCEYIDSDMHKDLKTEYGYIIGKLVNMQRFPEKWTL